MAQFDKGLADGVLYPRWAIDWTFGYGYPVFIVIAPLALYVAEVFHLLGAGIADALKLVYALSFLLSGLAMYLLARDLFGRAGGVLAAVLYIYAPYHLADVYVRADVAEFASFIFFPAIMWAILRLSRARSRSDVLRYIAAGRAAVRWADPDPCHDGICLRAHCHSLGSIVCLRSAGTG